MESQGALSSSREIKGREYSEARGERRKPKGFTRASPKGDKGAPASAHGGKLLKGYVGQGGVGTVRGKSRDTVECTVVSGRGPSVPGL